jgi:hypothetical protein
MKIGIKRFGSSVQINLACDGDYQAIELYDRLIKAVQSGEIKIDLKASRCAQASSLRFPPLIKSGSRES